MYLLKKFMKKIDFTQLVSSLILLMIMLLPCSAFAEVKEITAIQWYQKGYDYQMNEKDYDNAIFAYNKAIELNPQYGEAYNNRGIIYSSKGQYDIAIADYNKAIELNPQYAETYSNRGAAYSSKGQYDLAIIDYNKAIELNPRNAEPYNNRGAAYKSKGQNDLAIIDYNKAIELNPQNAETYNNRGNAYYSQGQYDLAIIDYNKVIELDPQNAKHYYIKALICHMSERNSEAIEAYTLFLRYALPTDPKIETAKYRIRLLGGTVD